MRYYPPLRMTLVDLEVFIPSLRPWSQVEAHPYWVLERVGPALKAGLAHLERPRHHVAHDGRGEPPGVSDGHGVPEGAIGGEARPAAIAGDARGNETGLGDGLFARVDHGCTAGHGTALPSQSIDRQYQT